MEDFPYEQELVAAVESVFAGLDLVALTDQIMTDRWYPNVREIDVIRTLDHFFGGVANLHLLNEDADDALPLTPDAIAEGQSDFKAWLRQRDGE